jgi:hypothetical protein
MGHKVSFHKYLRIFTHIFRLNNNKETKRPVRYRFDRFFVRSPYKTLKFRLEGLERINGGLFPSDHFLDCL